MSVRTRVTSDHRALVTGAASGLGLALVKQLYGRGCRVLATDVQTDRPDSLEQMPGVAYRRLDVTSDTDWAEAYDWVRTTWRGLDLLVNNAGVAAGGRIEYSDTESWRWIADINLIGVARGCRTFVPLFKEQHSGHVVNTASAAGLVHPARMTEYAAVKAGVVALSESLGYELEPWGVPVSVICPTFFRTGLAASLQGKDPASQEAAAKLITSADLDADTVAARVMDGVDKGRRIILTDRNGKIAYAAKRFARPLYDSMMVSASRRMARHDEPGS